MPDENLLSFEYNIFSLSVHVCLVITIVPNCIYMIASSVLIILLSTSFPFAFYVHFWCASPNSLSPNWFLTLFPCSASATALVNDSVGTSRPHAQNPTALIISELGWNTPCMQILPSRLTEEPWTQHRNLEELTPWGIHFDQW